MSLFDKLILGLCLLHPVYLSDVLSDVIIIIIINIEIVHEIHKKKKKIGVISKYSANSALSNCNYA